MTDNGVCVTAKAAVASPCRHVYAVYGIAVHSEIPLDLPSHQYGELAQIELRIATASFFDEAIGGVLLQRVSGSWYEFGRLPDQSSYARWSGVGEFLVSGDGRRIFCRQFDEGTTESFHVYLLGQALSCALVKRGLEPLHATAMVVNGEAVVFLGESGAGKSSLAACFLHAGHQMLTDDLLLLQVSASRVLAHAGPARIKLFPRTARRFFGNLPAGVRMNPQTEKLILPLDGKGSCSTPVPVQVIYSLAGPREVLRKQEIRFEPLSPREAFVELAKNTFNYRILDPERLQRQFSETARLVSLLPVRKLFFSRVWRQLPSIRDAIISNLNGPVCEEAACGD